MLRDTGAELSDASDDLVDDAWTDDAAASDGATDAPWSDASWVDETDGALDGGLDPTALQGGCQCAAGRAPASAPTRALLVLAAALAWRRRRRTHR